ncbi:CTP synthase [candidate division WOR-3 bacterium]|nr:CTP synthase [candidate division WOR-3 bacterium]
MAQKYVVVVGGVISGVGKGIASASIAKILVEYGYWTTAVKIDPYINFDAGTLRPTEHGEVWVTDDGGEIDQDLGNYERFIGDQIPKKNNITTGQIYWAVIEKERNGKFLGETVQFIPHIPDEIIYRIEDSTKEHEIAVIEIGGTIGDYENIPFLFALKSLERKLGQNSFSYVMLTYLPIPGNIGEMKTKPTQQAIKLLSQHGIFPDIILCRAKTEIDQVRKKKIEIYANIPAEMVISAPDISSVYSVPLNFERESLGKKILMTLDLKPKKEGNWVQWQNLVSRITNPSKEISIGMIGKYIETGNYQLEDAYISVKHALEHAGANLDCRVKIEWISASSIEKNLKEDLTGLENLDGVIVPGGFGQQGVEGKITAINIARTKNIPFLGLCLGMQLALIESARNILKLKDANSTEYEPSCPNPIITLLPSQEKAMENSRYGATMRLGAYLANIIKDTKVESLYLQTDRVKKDSLLIASIAEGKESFRLGAETRDGKYTRIIERHRHRFEVNPEFVESLEKTGIVFSGFHLRHENELPLMEFIELKEHPFFVATQAHPEFKSSLIDPSPLFKGFIEACLNRHYGKAV